MPRVSIDTTEATSFEATEPGPYPMTIGTVEIKNSKDNVPMMNVGFQFEDPAIAKKSGTVFRNYMLAGRGAGFSRDFLKAAAGIDIPIGGNFDFDTDDVIGRHVVVQIGNKEYNGNLQNEAERIIAA